MCDKRLGYRRKGPADPSVSQLCSLNNIRTRALKCINEDLICSSVPGLYIQSVTSGIRLWRIELCVEVCCGEKSVCGGGEDHHIPLQIMDVDKTSNVIATAVDCDVFLTALRSFLSGFLLLAFFIEK